MKSSNFNHLYHPNYRSDIDGLRGIAILLVVFFHISQGWKSMENIFHAGFIGVDIFFVISGFLISTIIFRSLENNTFSFVEFYSSRIRRLFPALIIVLLSALIFGYFFLFAEDFEYLAKHIVGSALYINNFLLWNESGYFDSAADLKPLLHLWSLSVEEQFYIFWPFVMWAFYKAKRSLLPLIFFLFLCSFGAHLFFLKANHTTAFYFPHLRAWELFVGSFISYFEIFKNRLDIYPFLNSDLCSQFIKNALSWIGFILLLLGLVLINNPIHYPGWLGLIFPVLGTALMVRASKEAWVNKKILSNKLFIWFGLISYPLYLWHWPLLVFERMIEGKILHHDTKLLIVLLAVLLAFLTVHYVERFTRRNKKINTIYYLASILIVALASALIVKNKGYSSRFPKEIAFITESYDYHWKDIVRVNVCHVELGETTRNLSLCYEKKRPLLALWGDSFASALYPGLKNLQDQNSFGIMQMTTGACPYLLNLEDTLGGDCEKENNKILDSIKQAKPNVLILASSYILESRYKWKDTAQMENSFISTIGILKKALPSSKIIVVGPMPQWQGSPQKTVFHYWLKSINKKQDLPYKMKATLYKEIDTALSRSSSDFGVVYISPYKILCDDDQCLTRTSNKVEDFTALDWGHLSKSGSIYFIGQISDQILDPLLKN